MAEAWKNGDEEAARRVYSEGLLTFACAFSLTVPKVANSIRRGFAAHSFPIALGDRDPPSVRLAKPVDRDLRAR
jgi:hypothetical protein